MTRPATDIHFCVTGGRAIFLDLSRNRYFALSSNANDAFECLAGDCKVGTVPATLLEQVAKGTSPVDCSCQGLGVSNARDFAAPNGDRGALKAGTAASPALILLVWLAVVGAKILVRLCPLRMVFAVLGTSGDNGARHADPEAIDRIGAAIRSVNLFVRNDGNCLPLTLAFVWLCRRFGHHPTLVIGVRVNPFSAHCWSQDGATVLNDSFERVGSYQPILVL